MLEFNLEHSPDGCRKRHDHSLVWFDGSGEIVAMDVHGVGGIAGPLVGAGAAGLTGAIAGNDDEKPQKD